MLLDNNIIIFPPSQKNWPEFSILLAKMASLLSAISYLKSVRLSSALTEECGFLCTFEEFFSYNKIIPIFNAVLDRAILSATNKKMTLGDAILRQQLWYMAELR